MRTFYKDFGGRFIKRNGSFAVDAACCCPPCSGFFCCDSPPNYVKVTFSEIYEYYKSQYPNDPGYDYSQFNGEYILHMVPNFSALPFERWKWCKYENVDFSDTSTGVYVNISWHQVSYTTSYYTISCTTYDLPIEPPNVFGGEFDCSACLLPSFSVGNSMWMGGTATIEAYTP